MKTAVASIFHVSLGLFISVIVLIAGLSGCGGASVSGNNPVSSPKVLTAFSLNGVAGSISETNKTIAVSMPSGTDVTSLVATFSTTGTTVKVGGVFQVTGVTANDFTHPIIYTVVGADASTATYTVTVTIATFYIGGKINGLESGKSLVLQNNGADDLNISANGAFTFASAVVNGSNYSVSIKTLPTNQPCTLTYGKGVASVSDIANVNVICGPAFVGTFSANGNLASPRTGHGAILLNNGKVLVIGGYDGTGYLSSAELYDSTAGTWSATGSMSTARYQTFTATLLPNGKVLVAGGGLLVATASKSAELYDPANGTWTATGSMATARSRHTATLLPNGKVLVSGGFSGAVYLSSSELYDPATGTWTATGNMSTLRARHAANLLPNGKVLVSGGLGNSTFASSEIYDPISGSWSATGSMVTARSEHVSTLLPNGKVLVVGGFAGISGLASAELYDPSTSAWSTTGSMASTRYAHTLTLLPTGMVLVTGGTVVGWNTIYSSAELYDPLAGNWGATGSMSTPRAIHTAILLSDGRLLITGGEDVGYTVHASSELYW